MEESVTTRMIGMSSFLRLDYGQGVVKECYNQNDKGQGVVEESVTTRMTRAKALWKRVL